LICDQKAVEYLKKMTIFLPLCDRSVIVITCIQQDFEPAITAFIHPCKPKITANEPAIIAIDLHLMVANQE